MCRLLLLLSVLFTLPAFGQGTAAINGYCSLGGNTAKVQGTQSTNTLQGIVPSCLVTVYITGTTNKATIFKDKNGTMLNNPFTANAINSVNPGGWIFWAAVNQGYDIVLSGGISPNTYSSPVTLVDRFPGFQFSGGGGSVTPCGTVGQIQVANASGTALACDPDFAINTLTHTMTSQNGNMLVGALSSIPRAIFDPMDTSYDGGLAAAIAGTSGFTPTQVIQAAIDAGECSIQRNLSIFHAIGIPLPSGVSINISGLKVWAGLAMGGDSATTGPNLIHNDASQPMISAHTNTDTLTCNGTVYTPGTVGGVLLHDFAIGGMFAPATNTDIGIEMNMFSSAAENIHGFGSAFGGPAVISNGTSTFLLHMGFPGAQLQGCKTYNTGVLPVSGFTVGGGRCASVMDSSLDGGMEDIYASDGQAFATGHTAGPCYPNCAAVSADGSGTYDRNIFAQVSSVGLRVGGNADKVDMVRVDFTSREAVQLSGGAFGGSVVDHIYVDSACTDTALQANYTAGTATGCFGVAMPSGQGYAVSDLTVSNNSGIFSQAYVQCWGQDAEGGFSGKSTLWDLIRYQGNTGNTTANDWAICNRSNEQIGPRINYPVQPPMQATTSTINVSGITSVTLTGSPNVTSIVGGTPGQRLNIMGNGTVKEETNILNLNGLDAVVSCPAGDNRSCPQVLEYVNTAAGLWVMLSGPPNQTPTHVNYFQNPTPSNPSLADVYGNFQSRLIPNFNIAAQVQLHGPTAPSGQYCFEQENLYADGSHVVSPLACTTVDLTAQTPGAVFVLSAPQATAFNLWLVSNTTGSAIAIGKFPPVPSDGAWDGPSTIAAGGNGATAPPAGENTTGMMFAPWGVVNNSTGNTQPPCNTFTRGRQWMIDGGGTAPDTFQICVETTGGAFAWVTH